MALYTLSSCSPLSFSLQIGRPLKNCRRFSYSFASLSSSSSSPPSKASSPSETIVSSTVSPTPFTESSRPLESSLNYALDSPNGNPIVRLVRSTESTIERVIFDFRFLALFAVGGSLAGSLLCFLNGCFYVFDAYKVYWTGCVKGIHTGQMVLRLVEAIDVYLAGTGSSLFGMFAMKERPQWMKINSLDELKTKVGHVIVMILLVKMFERSKMVTIATGLDLLSYSVCIFLSSASLYILHNLHK
ncbi:putative Structural constituent of ribosome [Quillaja saponaria]|uniref:Structural constituent of ribosome n=1 Tax=Quillaja saponaria TaxID=32244 RepID=A0AAD7QIQ0_QUISA|nr:putative Structural constituent of ribosome [Quillaja saponaria]